MVSRKVSKWSLRRWLFLKSSGLDRQAFETKLLEGRPNRIYIVYRDPATNKMMKKPDGRLFWRWKEFLPEGGETYRTCKDGGLHLYFPRCRLRGKAMDYLEAHPDAPVFITEGEKKAAKAWLEGIPCIGIPGIWCWLANKEDRAGGEKRLHPDFGLIPNLERRGVILVYDSDANDPAKRSEFDMCSAAFEQCLRARGVSRYEKIILPSEGSEKVGLDDYLMRHSISDFRKIVSEQSKTAPVRQFIMTSQKFLKTDFPPINFLIQPWLSDCQLTMVHAAPGVGKTNFLMSLSAAITRKNTPEDFCGWQIKKGAGVLFVDGEMPAPIMQRRLAKIEAGYPDNPMSKINKLWLLSGAELSRRTGKAIDFSDEHWRDQFSKLLAHHPAQVIILDNIVSLMCTKDENDAGA